MKAMEKLVGVEFLRRAKRVGVPFWSFHVGGGNEGRFATHRQSDVLLLEIPVDLLSERLDRCDLLWSIGQGDSRGFANALDLHVEFELRFGVVGHRE